VRPLRERKLVTMNMTPMIDVVFLLIIFFLVSSHLAQQETQLELDLPTASTGAEPEEGSSQRVTINLLADGRVLLGAEPTSLDELTERLAFESQSATEPLEVRVRADQSIDFGKVKPVLVACAKASVWDVRFAVLESHEEAVP
jgi:biopolymer transport protein ExbD